jgi:hypothetical protein
MPLIKLIGVLLLSFKTSKISLAGLFCIIVVYSLFSGWNGELTIYAAT